MKRKKYLFYIILISSLIGFFIYFIKTYWFDENQNNVDPRAVLKNSTVFIETTEKKSKPKPTIEGFQTPIKLEFDYSQTVNNIIPELQGASTARSGILIDMDSKKVLWSKKPTEAVAIASMTKMMTALLVLETINSSKKVSLKSRVRVSATSAAIGGSQVFLDPKEIFTIEDLLKTVLIASANDSAELLCEVFGPGRPNFIKKMNLKSKSLNLKSTKFFNATGLPGKSSKQDNISSPEALAVIAYNLLQYPTAMKYAGTRLDYFREGKTMLTNHNRLVKFKMIDGMKTGFTNRARFCTTVTALENGRRLIAVVTGFPTSKGRDKFVKKLLDWGYSKL